ncbi:Hypothetical predicted protein [Mytilus galloprovincialis]|uniref:Integrase zinc-binding domain-containing protein n=1 Tax=Mytilus galloprovincialis TaxID=29158 RepID=A0A8B6DSQ9_MYTGA|nr:Hypothetical predicted protein [Mytilus galloprovincialis]
MSIEDKKFMRLMSYEKQQDENQNWTAPLSFKESRPLLPNNRLQALNRARAFDISLRKDPVKKQHVLDFMKTLFDNNHAERAQNTETPKEMWYLPMFGVYHPKKKDRIRVVFDSSAKFRGTSLNDVLMTGPNLVNSLLGVLLRFRKDKIAITADIRQMFYSFNVTPEHRDFLRFIWHEDNDKEKDLVDYRMAVHVFGNSPSPAVATFGLRKTAEMAESKYGSDVVTYVNNNFYVDDALSSHSNSDKAVDLLKRTQSALKEFGNLRLHKISSNSNEVLAAFEKDDLSEDLKNLDFSDDCLPVQRSLGRGVLSVINGLYDPLGFAAPVTIAGKLILRETMKESTEWDEPLPPQFQSKWQSWKDSLKLLQQVEIPRNYSSDWTLNKDLFLAVELYETICEELKTEFQQVQFFTDSKVVLGYIHNETKRFYLYVGNRVDRIRRSTKPEQWSYVPTLQNPADDASRSIRPEKLNQSQWLIGPTQFLCKKNTIDSETEGDEFPLILPEEDRDVRVAKTLLDPFIDENGLLRAGGRLSNANIFPNELKPLIIAKHHIATLLKRHFHEKVAHQGRHLTEGALRSAGYWLIGGKGLISSVIHKCIKCKLRGKEEFPKMADLPFDRLDPAPPFSYVGIDVFGPWTITTRRTRGGQAQSKRWAVMFTCLVVRAVHIEVIEELSSGCFINALRRFCALRGEVKIIRSDCGTNFVGALSELNVIVINIGDRPIRNYLSD